MITTIILMIAYSGRSTELTDAEIIERAEALGMVMQEDNDPLFSHNSEKNETQTETESEIVTEKETEIQSEVETETQAELETEAETQKEIEIETEKESEVTTTGDTYHLVIPSGSVPRLICNELEENGVIDSSIALREYLVEVGYATSIRVGEYDIPYGASYEEIYQILKGASN